MLGLKFIEVQPVVRRTLSWKERLFSWPWRPLIRYRWVKNPAAPPPGEAYRVGDIIYATPETIRAIRRVGGEPLSD